MRKIVSVSERSVYVFIIIEKKKKRIIPVSYTHLTLPTSDLV